MLLAVMFAKKNPSVRIKACTWMNAGLLNSINEKHRLYRQSSLSPEHKKLLSKNIPLSNSNYYNNKLSSCQNDPRSTW